jgi:hypothetical protein
MGISIYMKRDYVNGRRFLATEKQSQFIRANNVFVIPVKTGIQIC